MHVYKQTVNTHSSVYKINLCIENIVIVWNVSLGNSGIVWPACASEHFATRSHNLVAVQRLKIHRTPEK